jgi:multiple sugar transport system substrate-binding protein
MLPWESALVSGYQKAPGDSMFKARLYALFSITLALIITLSGCAALQPATPTPQPVTLTFAYDGNASDYQALADQYQKLNPNITIKLAPITSGEYRGLEGLTNVRADVIRWDASLMSSDYLPSLMKLDPLLAIDSNFSKSDMVPGSLEALQTDGAQYGIPAGINPVVMYANPKHFATAGVDLPSPDWSLDDLVAIAGKVNAQQSLLSDPNYAVGLCTQTFSFDPLVFTYLFGGNIFDRLPNPTKFTFNRPENINAVQWYANLFTQYGVTPKLTNLQGVNTRVDTATLVQVNKCAMWIGFYSDLKNGSWGTNNENKPVMLPLPRGKATLNMDYMDGYFIASTAKNAKVAWDWIAFLSDHPEAALGMIPPRISQIKSTAFQKAAGNDGAAVANNLPPQIVVFSQNMGNYQFLGGAFRGYITAIQRVINGEASAQDALNQAQDEADKATPTSNGN